MDPLYFIVEDVPSLNCMDGLGWEVEGVNVSVLGFSGGGGLFLLLLDIGDGLSVHKHRITATEGDLQAGEECPLASGRFSKE